MIDDVGISDGLWGFVCLWHLMMLKQRSGGRHRDRNDRNGHRHRNNKDSEKRFLKK